MSEVIFSKKQVMPLIGKYSIDVENDNTFKEIIMMFPNQTNYHIWAIKAVYGGVCPLQVIKDIKAWSDENQHEIKNLIKGNIVSYTRKEEFLQLVDEIKGISMIAVIKRVFNRFNTDQKRILNDAVFYNVSNGIDALASNNVREWYTVCRGVEKLQPKRQETLISTSSALRNYNELKEMISGALVASYSWNRESLLEFAESYASDCEVVYDKDNVVILNVPSFKSSKILCGNGKTGWCLTRQESYFNQYVLNPSYGAAQYFLFNFNYSDIHDFARIGFTIQNKRGITNAHSSTNKDMLQSITTRDGQTHSIHTMLDKLGIDKGTFMKLKKLTKYTWDEKSMLEYISNSGMNASIAFEKDRILILKFSDSNSIKNIASHTYINFESNANNIYLLMNFGAKQNDSNSVIGIEMFKDKYGVASIRRVVDAYNGILDKNTALSSFSIEIDDFVNRQNIDPNLLLHKLIDEGNEERAIKLVQEKKIDVNHLFENQYPIFKAMNGNMFNLFREIVNTPTFNAEIKDGIGEPILLSLMCRYQSDVANGKKDSVVKNMIETILENENYNFNAKDLNFDTAINFAADDNVFDFVVEKLVQNPNVNLNVVNDLQLTSVGIAIMRKNLKALELLGRRSDLVVRESDKALAAKKGIDLSKYINPESLSNVNGKVEENGISSTVADLFAKVFNFEL